MRVPCVCGQSPEITRTRLVFPVAFLLVNVNILRLPEMANLCLLCLGSDTYSINARLVLPTVKEDETMRLELVRFYRLGLTYWDLVALAA